MIKEAVIIIIKLIFNKKTHAIILTAFFNDFSHNLHSPGQIVKGIRDVRLDNRKVVCASGPNTKYFGRFSVDKLTIYNKRRN